MGYGIARFVIKGIEFFFFVLWFLVLAVVFAGDGTAELLTTLFMLSLGILCTRYSISNLNRLIRK
jgi:hypothetical protein